MKHLLYYSLENDFKNDQIAVGGDGNNVVSVVDGVAWCRNTENAFYRYSNKDEDIVTYTVTVYYKDEMDEPLASSDIFSVPVYSGKSANLFIAPKSVENYEPEETGVTLSVSSNTEYTFTFIYPSPRREPLTFEITSAGNIRWTSERNAVTRTIEYRKNGGEWVNITSSTGTSAPSISVVIGDIVEFRGNNNTYSTNNINSYVSFSGSTCGFKVKGNIMSLIDSNNYHELDVLPSAVSFTFCYLFGFCTGLTNADELILPATALTIGCYESMFYKCKSLISVPTLPAMNLTKESYSQMFMYCTSLTVFPILPATGMAQYCYNHMFGYCTNLTTVPEGLLPATTLAPDCYANMFNSSGIRNSPDLPALTLEARCYQNMFVYCSKLSYVKCLATNISASQCISDWLYGVASSGTFVKNPNMLYWTRGSSGIPTNWTIQNAS